MKYPPHLELEWPQISEWHEAMHEVAQEQEEA
jgi:hypothetical protein